MTVTITQDIRDIAGVPDNVTVRFGSPVAREAGSSLITTKWTSFTAVGGILTAAVEPGPAKVMIRHVGTFDITIPNTASDLWSLIEAAVASPPTTSADQLAQAIGDYFAAHPSSGSSDEYHEYANFAAFPGTGAADRIYVDISTTPATLYRWTGSAYAQIGGGGGGGTAVEVATHAASSKATPVDADELPLVDSAASNGLKKLTFANLKAWVKSSIAKADVGLGSVDNTADTAKPVSTAQQTALDLKAPLASPTFTGTVAGITKAMVGLGSADNTADTAKPVSTAQQTALDLKAPLASPTFTGTVSGVTKAHVGLGSVDNTSDASKPVSTAQQTALDGKQPVLTATAVKTTTYTAAVNDLIPGDATSAGFTVTLPTAPADKSRIVVKKIDASTNAVTIARGGTDVFNAAGGSTSLSLTRQFQAVQLQYVASSGVWYVISTDVPLASITPPSTLRTVSVAYAATVTPNADTTDVLNIGALTGNLTLAAPTGTPVDGQLLRVRLVQDGTGSRTITYNAAYAFGTDVTAALDPSAANSKWERMFSWHAGDSKWRATAIVRGF